MSSNQIPSLPLPFDVETKAVMKKASRRFMYDFFYFLYMTSFSYIENRHFLYMTFLSGKNFL